jgi:hypothetical protein
VTPAVHAVDARCATCGREPNDRELRELVVFLERARREHSEDCPGMAFPGIDWQCPGCCPNGGQS